LIVVIDTNILISALHFEKVGSTIDRALVRAMSEDVIAICPEIESELRKTLTAKFNWSPDRVLAALSSVLGRAMRVRITGSLQLCRDRHDDMFLECAEVAGANLLITGDKDLLILASHRRTRIITPADYVSLVG